MQVYQLFLLIGVALCVLATVPKKHPLSRLEAAKDYVEVSAGFAYVNDQKQRVETFYISKYEITNAQYQVFLEELKAQENEELYQLALPKHQKPASWKKTPLAEGALIPQYTTYQAFADFPVVGITYEAAKLYCTWLTEQAKEQSKGGYEIEFRLPSQAEWTRAARGETQNEYAWNSPYLQDEKGYFQCNFKRISAEKVTFNPKTNAYEIVPPTADYREGGMTDKVYAYTENEFGLYNICGNVAEMIADEGKALGGSWNDTGYDVRVESMSGYSVGSPYVGFRPVMIIKERK
ncbi:formylglycine-generating enzyme family protein [Catalinimonas niigatensis]|uniref:formylglycine-generating enzyme family protein n=1 Tax=Catalinimonas niigatensis TaxID=1397264 RepID=UPI002666501E|nr:SUMF1/EgtB/PvdO family nonheme iron enzyme [Catalinimonas niigatensis]WPP50602.1 SUMF1/EgtB/PvdO family nonheme iron enzyme [Catalinimonas niigatensis]